jgi:hypothetical protein
MNIDNIIKRILKEATADTTGARGSYIPPLQPGMRDFGKDKLAPFTQNLNNYKSPLVSYDSYDKKFDLRKNQIKELEKNARKITDYIKHHPYSTFSDEEGNAINPTPSGRLKKPPFNKEIVPIKEANTAVTAGEYTGPLEIGLKKWKDNVLSPFTEFIDTKFNHQKKQKTLKNNINKTVGVWEKNSDGTYKQDEHDVHTINEDLAVWFGKKKKPKGSKQPKGPWVDICRKVNGKHPPCGRSDADTGSYPKCRAAGVAGKMSDSAKRAACQQKRRAEKQDTQSGKGQKPVMTSYKPRKKTNENMSNIKITENQLKRVIDRLIKEESELMGDENKSQMVVLDDLWNREMAVPIEFKEKSIQKDYQIEYGYNKLGLKVVLATNEGIRESVFGMVELECDKNRINFDTKALTNEKYKKFKVDMEKQKQMDYEKLKPYCLRINWEYGKRIKKRNITT